MEIAVCIMKIYVLITEVHISIIDTGNTCFGYEIGIFANGNTYYINTFLAHLNFTAKKLSEFQCTKILVILYSVQNKCRNE